MGVVGDACAWLPADAAMTPRARAASGSAEQEVERAPFLERGGELQVLELEPDPRARDLGERLRQGVGVATTAPAIAAAAARTSGRVTGRTGLRLGGRHLRDLPRWPPAGSIKPL